MTLGQLVLLGSERLRGQGLPTPRLDVELLLAHHLDRPREWLFAHPEQNVSDKDLDQFFSSLNRRSEGEPIAYIVGFKDFYKSRFVVSPDVLVPRPETELVVEYALHWMVAESKQHWRVVDLGTGSGCIGLSVIKEISNSALIAIDKSFEALKIAEQNAGYLGVLDRAKFLLKDVRDIEATEIGEKVDLVLGNPPYVASGDSDLDAHVVKYEPSVALFAQDNGLACCHLWIDFSQRFLRSDGLFLMEIGAKQRGDVISYLDKNGAFCHIECLKDYAGMDRIIRAVRR